MNRLAGEASPYLLQHARNPVDWWPWCPEALAEAKASDRPILLSIGYSACHWCHVMERESFEDPAIAAAMNERFVCIKVDREERPDLDHVYQLTVQLMGRSGGWPLTVFLTPSQRPFFAGTYFPPVDKYGMPGFPKILAAVSEAYRERREEVDAQAEELTKAIAEVGTDEAELVPGPDLLDRVVGPLLRRFDETHGGFGRAPKFPNTMPLEVLMRSGDGLARDRVRLALDAMRKGGVWDHLAGGFHRYSTDERWLVPHFEKMLYDNALLLRSYVDGFRVFRDEAYAATARGIAEYVTREMTDPGGGYYASQDADSEGEEGKFFLWDTAEVRAVGGDVAVLYFGEEQVLHEARSVSAVAARLDTSAEEASAAIEHARRALFEAREKRPKPFRDEKILTSWTALMAGAMADAGVALDEPRYVASAERALDRIVSDLLVGGGRRAQRLVKDDVVKGPGFLDDHAFAVNAFLDLYEATGDPSRVAAARALTEGMLEAFHAGADGFFFTPRDGETLITRAKDPFDNAIPSGFAMACRGLLRLGALVGDRYASIAERELLRVASAAVGNPFAYGQSLCELDRLVRGSVDVVLVGPRADEQTRALARAVFASYVPTRTLAWLDLSDPASVAACAALSDGKSPSTAPVAYVCRGQTCSLPVSTPSALEALLRP